LAEGIETTARRYREAAAGLAAGLTARGFQYVVADPAHRLPMLHCVALPAGLDADALRRRLYAEGIEIGPGLGDFADRAVRIGLMGPNASPVVATRFLATLDQVVARLNA